LTETLTSEHREIRLDLLDILPGRRAQDPNWVETLAADFRARGQRTPIEVIQRADRFQLVSGGHRVGAARFNGQSTIIALVKQPADFASEAEIKLAEIVENFMRRELSALDRAMDVAAWREIFEAVKGTVKRGGDRRSGSKSQLETLIAGPDQALDDMSARFAATFTDAAQKALGLSRPAVFRHLKIASIGESVRQLISLLPIADNQSELIALVGHPQARQLAIAEQLVAGAANVADAIAILDNLPPPPMVATWERMSERFARLKPAEQELFFSLHADAFLKWHASRKR
jgi:ParB family chromosome partitioning protein